MDLAKGRGNRQEAIRRIIRNKPIRTQRVLVDTLQQQGFACTQATISRDIHDMDVRKTQDGFWILSEDLDLQDKVSKQVVDVTRADNLVLVKASPGNAQGVAAAIDNVSHPNVLGTVAGNDTVLVVTGSPTEGEEFERHIQRLRNGRR